jgi:excinuclease ABC subunit C
MQRLLENLPKIKITSDFFKSLPETAGIYAYFKNDQVIYVGKAINLKHRVSSYFDLDLQLKTARMISEATHLSFIQVDSELEALLLEAKLIRSYMPRYNIELKDDKHPLYIVITKEEFPRVITVRKLDLTKNLSLANYGPFPSSRSIYTVLRMLRRIFPYADHRISKRPCLYSRIGLCNPCPNEITNIQDPIFKQIQIKKYKKNIKKIRSILDGHIDKVTKGLEKEMNNFSKAEDYENAASVRNQINQLEYITRPQMPTDFYMQNPNLYEDQRKLEIVKLKELIENCELKIENLSRIECYDVAHLSGTNATASMITFINGESDKSLYRHFKIKKSKGGDDYASMREVAERRKKHFEDWGMPDLIIVDGGVGQIKSFKEKISEIPVVGIAKHPDRLVVGEEKIKLEGPALNLVARIRDEAHRFARRYHHKLVSLEIRK